MDIEEEYDRDNYSYWFDHIQLVESTVNILRFLKLNLTTSNELLVLRKKSNHLSKLS